MLSKLLLAAMLQVVAFAVLAQPARAIPKPLPAHPGNIFLAGEPVLLELPQDGPWTLWDYEDQILGTFRGGKAAPGKLAQGFYRFINPKSNWVSLAVIEPLRVPTPRSSPIGIDAAMAWFYPEGRMDAVANLCALAGINWVRDRLAWGEMEPRRGGFVVTNKYDASAAAQARAGLRVLQVIHHSPPWANPTGKRFPLDLRDAYRFYEAMAKRWKGQVQAFEPWNEADIPMFGGHTGAEMAALQKAACLGLKAGNPQMIACLNVFATHNLNQLADLNENAAAAYFDTYNLHHYEPFDRYPKLYADHRAVSGGRPLWVTECAVPVKWAGDEKLKEPSDSDLRVQAERVAKTFACSLHEGSAATFYFLLPNYVEGQTQFGIMRPDLTPRPAFVALAAVGRLLADAKPLGKLEPNDPSIRAYAFKAKPGGKERAILVAWSTNREALLELPGKPGKVFDHLGRPMQARQTLALSAAPIFVSLRPGASAQLKLSKAPAPPLPTAAKRSKVVMQVLWPEAKLGNSAYVTEPGRAESIPIFLYNFGEDPLVGKLKVVTSSGCEAAIADVVELAPMSRIQTPLTVTVPASLEVATIRISGHFGEESETVLSLRIMSRQQ